MAQTKEKSASRRATSPTSVAPVLVGFDDSAGGHDALGLSVTRELIAETPCPVLVVPHVE